MICCIPAAKPKLLNWKFRLHRLHKHVRCAFHLVSLCQVRGSLCWLCIVHILSSVWAGMDYSWGIWVSQNLTTEWGTSWGPAEENKARCGGLRRLSGRSVKDWGNLCLCWTGSRLNSMLIFVRVHVLLNCNSFVLWWFRSLCYPCPQPPMCWSKEVWLSWRLVINNTTHVCSLETSMHVWVTDVLFDWCGL